MKTKLLIGRFVFNVPKIEGGRYFAYEVEAPSGYKVSQRKTYLNSGLKSEIKNDKEIFKGMIEVWDEPDGGPDPTDLTIEKLDADSGTDEFGKPYTRKLPNVTFVIDVEWTEIDVPVIEHRYRRNRYSDGDR